MTAITICFISNRKDAKFDWFCDSLFKQLRETHEKLNIQLLYIDFWRNEREIIPANMPNIEYAHISPLPSFCQGQHRLTSINWFSATIMRNTGLVFAIHPYAVFCDDLSVLQSGWLAAVVEAAKGRYVIQGAYRKDLKMEVENGVIKSSHHDPHGQDSRARFARNSSKVVGRPEWCYGNIGLPVELGLKVNGWDELCSICSYEDAQFGQRLGKAGATFYYDTRMLSVESQELHFVEGAYFTRQDPEVSKERYEQVLGYFGCKYVAPHNGRHDSSHIIVELPRQMPTAASYWNNYHLRDLRRKREAGEQITVEDMKFPDFWWFDGKPISEM